MLYSLLNHYPAKKVDNTNPSVPTKSTSSSLLSKSFRLLFFFLLVGTTAKSNDVLSRANGNWNSQSSWIRTLSGTVSAAHNSFSVTGNGTLFLSELTVGSILYQTDGTAIGTVQSIASDILLTLAAKNNGAKTNVGFGNNAIPLATDDVKIVSGVSIILNQNATVNSLSLLAPAGSGVSLLTIGAYTLTVSNDLELVGGANPSRQSKLTFSSSLGIVDVNGNLNVGNGSANPSTATIDMGNGANHASTLKIRGTLVRNTLDGAFIAGSSSNVEYLGSAAQVVETGLFNFANLRFNNTAGVTLGAPVTASNVTSNISVTGGLLLTNNHTMTMAASKILSVASGAIMDAGTSIITLGSAGIGNISGSFKTANLAGFYGGANTAFAGSPSLNLSGSTVEFSGSGQVVTSLATLTYNNLLFSGGNKIVGTAPLQNLVALGSWDVNSPTDLSSFNTTVSIGGDITGTGTITKGNKMITLGGNWLNTGLFPANASMTFNSASAINIPTAIYDTLGIGGAKAITGNITANVLALSGNARLTLGSSNISLNQVTGFGPNNFIVTNGSGLLEVNNVPTGIAQVFPVGVSATSYSPVSITPSTLQNWIVRVQPDFTGFEDPNSGAALQRVWILNGSAGPSAGLMSITFQYNESDVSWITPARVHVCHFDTDIIPQKWMRAASSNVPTGIAGGIRTVTISGQFNFSTFAIQNPAVVLPVNFLSFSAKRSGRDNQLSWSTSQEFNNTGFDVERSVNGVHYQVVGFVQTKAVQDSNPGKLSYNFSDINVPGIKHYYRLRQVDQDGRRKLSSVVQVKDDAAGTLVINGVFANEVGNEVKAWIDVPASAGVRILVVDASGKILKAHTTMLSAGTNALRLDMQLIARGWYVLKVQSLENGETASYKFSNQ